MRSISLRTCLALALVLITAACLGVGSKGNKRDDGGEWTTPASADAAKPIKQAFYARASEGNWYIVGRTTFTKLSPEMPGFVIAKDPSATSAKLVDGHPFHSLDIAPDGQGLLAKSRALGTPHEDLHLVIFDGGFGVRYQDRAETDVNQKGDNTRSAIRWSHDGLRLAYAQSGKVWLIEPATRDPEGPGRRMLVDDHLMKKSFEAPSWGPEDQLVYESATRQLTIVELDSGAKRVLGPGRVPSWSPDGKTIVFRDEQGMVHAHDLASGEQTALFRIPRLTYRLLWTPDSRYILVDRRIPNSIETRHYLYSFEGEALVDLERETNSFDDRLVEVLPSWIEQRLVPLQ